MKILCHLITLVLLISSFSNAQTYSFTNITEQEGLSEDDVYDIFQDKRGLLWFITPDGVNLYDGYKFSIFRNDPYDSNSISPGISICVEESNESIWIGTTRGLNRYDPINNSFSYYSIEKGLSFHQITTLYKDSDGTLWVGMGDIIGGTTAGGLAHFDQESNRFTSSVYDSIDRNSLSNNFVTDIVDDKKGILWISTANGLNKFNKLNQSFERFYLDQSDSRNERKNFITDLFYDSYKNLWVGTDYGLYKFDQEIKAFQKIDYTKKSKSRSERIFKIYETPSDPGILWIGTDNGIFEFDTKTGISNNYTNDENDPSSLASNLVRDILEDHSGILWFAAGNKGLTKLNRFRPNFKYILTDIPQTRVSENNVYTLYKDDENLYAGTYEDIIKIDLIKGSKIPLARKFNLTPYIRHNRINSIFIDHLDRYWIGTSDNGILVVQSDTLLAHISEGSKNRLQSNKISFIRAFNNSDLWVGTRGGGLDQIDLTTLSIKAHYIDSSASNKVNVLSYFQDGNDYLWIGTTRGIRKFDLREKMFIPFNFEETFESEIGDDMVLNIISNGIEDSILWLGTLNRGLCRLDLASGEFKRITLQNSNLPSNTINSILDFGNSTLWLTTNNRLVRYDTKNDESRVYSSDDGVKINKFHAKSAYKDENRRLYFGGTEGILNFDPSKVKKNLNLPKLIVNDFLINGKSIIRKGNKSFVQHIIYEKEISLNHDQNSITIEFVALHFASPQNNKYEYQLINYDEKPILTTTQRRITYRNLSPGSYMFKLKASNADGIKAANELAYEIIISPPFYKTWWAYTLYILVLIGLVQLYRKYEVNKQLEASRIKESELRAEQAELKAETAAAQAKVIQIESERQTKELEDARKLQLSMLPETIPLSDKFEIAVYMRTASEVGGDYYDFSISEDETLNIGFGDATGHGMQAGVVVSLIKGLFVSDSADNDLATFMLKSNNTIKKSRLGRMMMAFTLLKLKDNRIQVSSAGMPPILMYSKKSQHVEEINLMGMPLGAMLDFPYKDFNLQLDQGDTLLLMSDGLPELANEEGEQMAYFRISKIFKDVGSRNPDRIIEAIVEAADEWRGEYPIEDDISLLVLKIK